MTVIIPIPPKYSHLTQRLLNYFPDTDVRIRENALSLGAQLLNAVAFSMEKQNTRITRELRALNLSDVPMNIDNAGVYFGARVPLSFTLPVDSQGILQPPNLIQGQIHNGPLVTLIPYDDMLPIPTRVVQDPNIPAAAITDPKIFDVVGDGSPKSFTFGTMPIPNFLTFQVSGLGPVTSAITVSITGELDPPAVWPQDVKSKNEILVLSDDGFTKTDSVWSSVSAIDITGLPVGCELVCYSIGFQLSAESDNDRPFTHFGYRGVAFPRYWQLHDLLLLEVYQRNRFAGYETFQAYHTSTQMVDTSIEPNTSGLFLTDGINLLYVDRRTPMPEHLEETGNTNEPAFGINVYYDFSQPGDTTFAFIQPQAFATASTITQYRYVVEDPNGNLFILLPSGILQVFTGTGGWQQGLPQSTSFALGIQGTYIISLEMLGTFNARTSDTYPFGNFGAQTKTSLSLAGVVPSVQGIAFDAYDKLWVWTGQFAIPLKFSYDAYVFDPSTRTIFTTDIYDEVQIS